MRPPAKHSDLDRALIHAATDWLILLAILFVVIAATHGAGLLHLHPGPFTNAA